MLQKIFMYQTVFLSNKRRIPKFIVFLSAMFLSIGYGMSPERWRGLPEGKKVEFHRLLLRSISDFDSTRLDFSDLSEEVPWDEGEGVVNSSCIYGGWVSTMRDGVCQHPYQNRENNGYDVCTSATDGEVHRCNPILFGERDEGGILGSLSGKGTCVSSKRDSASITWSCVKAVYGSEDGSIDVEKFREYLQDLGTKGGSGRYLGIGEYLALATKIVEDYCTEGQSNFCAQYVPVSSCHQLRRAFFKERDSYSQAETSQMYSSLLEESPTWKKIRKEWMVPENLQSSNFWPHQCNPLSIVRKSKGYLRERLGWACLHRKEKLEQKIMDQTYWGKLSLGKRAEEVYRLAQESYADIVAAADNFISRTGRFNGDEQLDGSNVFHNDANPSMAACVVFHETKGDLNPFSYNYSYCRKEEDGGWTSSAFGLGQITRSTLQDLADKNNGSQLPLITPEAKKFFGPEDLEEPMSGEEIYRYSNLSPKFHLELVLRVLNEKAKKRSTLYGSRYQLSDLVRSYSGGDNFESYKKNISDCMKCFKRGRTASDCYYIMEGCQSWDCRRAKQRGYFSWQ